MSKLKTAWLNEGTGEIVTPAGRMVWPTLLEPKGMKGVPESKPKYSIGALLLPKDANLDLLKTAVAEVAREKHGKDWQKKKLFMPIGKTAEHPKLAEYAEEFPFYIKASANEGYPPFVYGPDTKPFKGEPSAIYSGRWAIMSGKPYGYDNVSKGVNFGLNRVMLREHDEAIAGGRIDTAVGFEAVDVGEEAGTDAVFGGVLG